MDDVTRAFDPGEPRDEAGKWTDGGSSDGGSANGGGKGKHPGKGYSKDAYLDSKGVIHTSNVYDAQRALFEDRKVELKQVKQLSTLIKRLGETAAEMAEHGETAPTFNLCNVSVKGTNLFCADQIGIPRVEMPVIRAGVTKDFIKYLKKQGYDIEKTTEEARNLRATQNEISGTKVAAAMNRIKEEGFYKRLVVSRDDYILDGHHTWAGQLARDARDGNLENDGREVKIARVDISITKLLEEAEKWTGGAGKKPASEPAKGYRHITLKQAQRELDAETYQKFAEVAYRFFAANGHLARRFDHVMVTVREWDEDKETKDFDPNEPRDESGKWTSGGGGDGGSSAADIPDTHLDPKVVEVGGDAWNKATAKRLEREYQAAKPKLDEMLTVLDKGEDKDKDKPQPSYIDPEGKEVYDLDDEEKEEPEEEPIPEGWEQLNDNDQEDVKQEYFSKNLDSYVEDEKELWYNNGGATDTAKAELAGDVNFIHDTIKDYIEENETDTGFEKLYTPGHLANAIGLEYDSNGEGTGDLTVDFNDDKLKTPIGAPPPEQQTLPGIEPEDLSKRLTEDMRAEIETVLTKAFDKKADDMSGSVDPPDHLTEQAQEFMEENWENMSDKAKFNFAKNETDTITNLEEMTGGAPAQATDDFASVPPGLPKTWDPLNSPDSHGADYKKTQRIARLISLKRAEQVLKDRNLPYPGFAAMQKIDNKLWSEWKGSSTSLDGQLLQVATADELGGRLNPKTGQGGKVELNKAVIARRADNDYAAIGGYAGVKAYVRAKWETTQFLLDKANIKELELYRGINLDQDKYTQAWREKMETHLVRKQVVEGGYEKVPNLHVVRNGAASTSVSAQVANDWSSGETRIVLRALMPRTAAVSIPAYGINVKSEQEVVVAGTAWKNWDAWLGKAPTFRKVAMAA